MTLTSAPFLQNNTQYGDREPDVGIATVTLAQCHGGYDTTGRFESRSPQLVAPAPDRLIAEQHASGGHHLFDITKAHCKTKVQPNAVRDDLSREPMATVRTVRHSSSMSSAGDANVTMPTLALKPEPQAMPQPARPGAQILAGVV